MLLLSLVLIYSSGLALNTHTSCLLSFLLAVNVESNLTSHIFTPDALRATFTAASVVLARHGCASGGRLPHNSPCRLEPPHPLSPEEME